MPLSATTLTIGAGDNVNVDDVVKTTNHFRCIDLVLDHADDKLSEKLIKELHLVLKNGTSDSRQKISGLFSDWV